MLCFLGGFYIQISPNRQARMVVAMAFSLEPDLIKGSKPEETLKNSLLQELMEALTQAQSEETIEEFFILPEFGFNLAVFIQKEGLIRSRFLNMKIYTGTRPKTVEIGDQKGSGNEMEILLLNKSRISMAEEAFRWVLCDITKQKGNRRYSIFSPEQAKEGLFGGLNKKKQNSIKLGSVMTFPLTWDELSVHVVSFLIS
ncbi:MAG TPA: hypothetical protein DCG87_05545 [Synergistaceae bacterium]|nr:hypothetical protein [Synergistaceae bacterium]